MRLLRTVLPGIMLLSATFTYAQSADDVVNKYFDAIGGKALIGTIKSQVTSANLSVMGSDLTAETTILVGKGFKNIANFNGQEIIQCITPGAGWMINPLQGQTDPVPLPEEQVKAAQGAFEIGGELYNYQAKGSKIESAGTESVDGVTANKIKLTNKDGVESFFSFDPATGYLLKRENTNPANGQTATSLFSNYKKTKIGLTMPYTTVTNSGFEITINVTNVEFNVNIDPKIFEMPK